MADIIPDRIEVPYRDRLEESDRRLTIPWQNFFRKVQELLDIYTPSYLFASSDVFPINAPGSSGSYWADMVNNSVTLTPGIWSLSGSASSFYVGGTFPSKLKAGFFAANGNNTASLPTQFTGPDIIQGGVDQIANYPTSVGNVTFVMPNMVMRVTVPTTVYMVVFAQFSSDTQINLYSSFIAQRALKIKGG